MTQDEIIRMAREAGFSIHNGIVTGGVSDLEHFWNDAVIEGRNIQIFKDDAERANEFDPDWDGTLELVEEIKRLAIENERLRHGEIKYEDWEFNPMTGESLWGKQPVSQEPVAWFVQYKNRHEFVFGSKPEFIVDGVVEPLYAAPVRTKDLTDDEIWKVIDAVNPSAHIEDLNPLSLCRAVIAADREKNK